MTTQRKTDNAISFYNNERVYEGDAVSKRTKNARNSFVFLNKFLGALETDSDVISISRKNYEDYLI